MIGDKRIEGIIDFIVTAKRLDFGTDSIRGVYVGRDTLFSIFYPILIYSAFISKDVKVDEIVCNIRDTDGIVMLARGVLLGSNWMLATLRGGKTTFIHVVSSLKECDSYYEYRIIDDLTVRVQEEVTAILDSYSKSLSISGSHNISDLQLAYRYIYEMTNK